MKKYLLSVICIFAFSTYLQAQEPKEEPHGLIGFWQQCVIVQNPNDPEEQKIYRTPNFKFLNKDGSFINMVLSDRRQIANITVCGTYEVNSDKNYTEIVEKSYTNPNDTNRKVKMDYKLSNEDQFLVISYFSINPRTGNAEDVKEFWVKVMPGNPFEKTDE